MSTVFVKWRVDALDEMREAATTSVKDARLDQRLEAADRFFHTWADSHQGATLETGNGMGLVTIAAVFLDELTQMRRAYRTAAGPVSVGVGHQAQEADQALELAQARGGNRAVIHSSQTDLQLSALRTAKEHKTNSDPLAGIQAESETPEVEPSLNEVMKAERFTQAAFRKIDSGTVVATGPFHNIYELPEENPEEAIPKYEAGFIGDDGVFYTRAEAGSLFNQGPLTSEDLATDLAKADQFHFPFGGGGTVGPVDNTRSVKYVRRLGTLDTPNYGERFNQHVEPAGEYMSPHDHDPKNMPPMYGTKEGAAGATYMEYGHVHFNNPLVVPHNNNIGWKKDVSAMFGGKAGKDLSRALKRKGHDGIIAMGDDGEPQEIVNLGGRKEVVQPYPSDIEYDWRALKKLPRGFRRQLPPGDLDHHPEPGVPNWKHPTTPEFRSWFGNSRALDNNGEPLVVFHGTRYNFNTFDPTKRGHATGAPSAGLGYFFSRRPRTAESYTNVILPEEQEEHERVWNEAKEQGKLMWRFNNRVGANARDVAALAAEAHSNLIHHAYQIRTRGGHIMPVYLSLQNPLVFDMKNAGYREQSYKNIIDQAKANGNDGVIIRNTYDAVLGDALPDDVYVAFHPEQIKSALGNQGTFDPSDSHLAKGDVVRLPGTKLPYHQRGISRFDGKTRLSVRRGTPPLTGQGNPRSDGTPCEVQDCSHPAEQGYTYCYGHQCELMATRGKRYDPEEHKKLGYRSAYEMQDARLAQAMADALRDREPPPEGPHDPKPGLRLIKAALTGKAPLSRKSPT